jgi:hypothetical protein
MTALSPEQIRRARRSRDLLWNSPTWRKLPEDDRIDELRSDCMFIVGNDKELADKLVMEALHG